MALPLTILCGVFLAVIALYFYKYLNSPKTSALPLPPGPRGLPIVGNINDLPKPGKLECHHWAEHRDRYGQCKSYATLTNS
jgi:hypothetical protein